MVAFQDSSANDDVSVEELTLGSLDPYTRIAYLKMKISQLERKKSTEKPAPRTEGWDGVNTGSLR